VTAAIKTETFVTRPKFPFSGNLIPLVSADIQKAACAKGFDD
jgi:hypothetical protein